MATVKRTETTILVEVEVHYRGKYPFGDTRKRFVEGKLQEYADKELADTLRVLRFAGEDE